MAVNNQIATIKSRIYLKQSEAFIVQLVSAAPSPVVHLATTNLLKQVAHAHLFINSKQ